MKFKRSDIFAIAKEPYSLGESEKNGNVEYSKWVEFIDAKQDEFIWKENTRDGIETLANINKVPESFKQRVLSSLNKGACFKEFDTNKEYYNINLGFNIVNNRVSIGFERTPRLEDLKIFVEMAKYLDALLLKDGKEIIDEKMIESIT